MRVLPALLLVSVILTPASGAQSPVALKQTLSPGEQKTFEPGYAVGDIAIGDPKIADYRVLGADRKTLILLGKGLGVTTLQIWDQQRRSRHEVSITVVRAESEALEAQLVALLRDFPAVEIRRLAASLVLAGSVSSKEDLTAIEKIASAAKISSVVRYVPPTPLPAPAPVAQAAPPVTVIGEPKTVPPTPAAASPAAASRVAPLATPAPAAVSAPGPEAALRAPAGAPPAPAPVPGGAVVYEIELLEASMRFRTGSYATGIEPSGRRIYAGVVQAPQGQTSQVFIGGPALVGAPGTAKKGAPAEKSKTVETGIRLYLTPEPPDASGKFRSRIMVETNLPFGSDLYDPEAWRRARLEFSGKSGEPFAITGTDLLASPDISTVDSSRLGAATSGAGRIGSLPGVDVPGLRSVPIFGSLFGSRQYRSRTTQLLVILRPVVQR